MRRVISLCAAAIGIALGLMVPGGAATATPRGGARSHGAVGHVLAWSPLTHLAAADLPEMCQGRSDPNLGFVAQASGQDGSVHAYFADVRDDASGTPTGRLVADLGGPERLVVVDWCRAWQHLAGQPSNGSCGMTYPAGAITAHAVGTAEWEGRDVLVRTDVRQLATGKRLFRLWYTTLATTTTTTTTTTTESCESGWTKLPPEGWYPLGTLRVGALSSPAGYRLATSQGGVFAYNAPFLGSMSGGPLTQPVVGITQDPASGGYWLATAAGAVSGFGGAPFYGSIAGAALAEPVVGMAEDPPTDGYWLTAADGGVFAFGDAPFSGSMGGRPINSPVVAMADDPATGGYWLVAADGGVFSFNAPFLGSMGAETLNSPVVGMAVAPDGRGYWLVAADGGVFSFGTAGFYGSMGAKPLNEPVVGMAAAPDGQGYWLVAADGGVFSFGTAGFYGSATTDVHRTPAGGGVVGIAGAG